jgi:hypothetical protein
MPPDSSPLLQQRSLPQPRCSQIPGGAPALYPVRSDCGAIRPSIAPNRRRFRCPSASRDFHRLTSDSQDTPKSPAIPAVNCVRRPPAKGPGREIARRVAPAQLRTRSVSRALPFSSGTRKLLALQRSPPNLYVPHMLRPASAGTFRKRSSC